MFILKTEALAFVISFTLFLVCITFVAFGMALIGWEKIKEFWENLK